VEVAVISFWLLVGMLAVFAFYAKLILGRW
jgi:hypothetical protein